MSAISYESQLTPDELQQIQTALADPDPNILKLQRECPPWRDGPNAGTPPALKTLYRMAAQLRAERVQAEFETTTELWQTAQAEILSQPAYSASSSQAINQIFSLICHEIIHKTLYGQDSKTRIYLLRLLVRYQHLLLEKARFQRMAVEKFEAWYQNGPARQRLEELENATWAQRIEALGYAIFGEDWRPMVTTPLGIPGLDPAATMPAAPSLPTTNEQPSTEVLYDVTL